jgi:hypothetical protein
VQISGVVLEKPTVSPLLAVATSAYVVVTAVSDVAGEKVMVCAVVPDTVAVDLLISSGQKPGLPAVARLFV